MGNENNDFEIVNIYICSKLALHKTVEAFDFKLAYLNLMYK